jgi:hypothetical protein
MFTLILLFSLYQPIKANPVHVTTPLRVIASMPVHYK